MWSPTSIDIKTCGLSALLKVPCYNTNCNYINCVPTGKRHNGIWDANSKLATAMVHSGIGGRQVNSFLSALNIPPVSNTLLSKREKEMGSAMECVAQASVMENLSEEVKLSKIDENTDGLTVSVDGAWQKRGSGRSFDSLSGHCSMIGAKTGKVVGYNVRSKFCKTCDNSAKKGKTPNKHDCRMNWSGSAKAMEQDMVVEMMKTCKEKGAVVETIIADDDTTTIARIKQNVNPSIKKKSDKNHVKKNIGNALYSLRNKHKKLQNPKVFKYLQKCLDYMLAQNQGNSDGIENGLEAISRHPFGDHSFCQSSWCHHIDNPSRKYSSFPYGKPLRDIPLQTALGDLMHSYKSQSQKLSSMGSTQANESFNKTVASKAPKTQFYSGSASLNRRIASAVAQKNDGQSYLLKVYRELGLSPGCHTRRLALLRDMQARKRKAICSTWKYKLRRIQLKNRRVKSNAVKELREGDSYGSSVELMIHQDINEIPSPRVPPKDVGIKSASIPVYFDLETTGLGRNSHITQMAAVCGENQWQCFVKPKVPISTSASDVTGITMRGSQMFHRGKPVHSSNLSSALESFVEFISRQGKCAILSGHNIKSYDCHVLFNALEAVGKMDTFKDHVAGFVDTKLLFRSQFPGLPSYSQQALVSSFLHCDYAAHDALQDVVFLQRLVRLVNFDEHNRLKASFSLPCATFSHESLRVTAHNLPSLQGLVNEKIITKCMGTKIAASDLNYAALKLAFSRGEEEGIRQVLSEECGSRPRVTKSSKIIHSIAEHFRSTFLSES